MNKKKEENNIIVKEGCCHQSEDKDKDKEDNIRKQKVAALLEQVQYKTEEDKLYAINSYSNSKLTLEEIDQLLERQRPGYFTMKTRNDNDRGRAGIF